jgi:hypothetical protein
MLDSDVAVWLRHPRDPASCLPNRRVGRAGSRFRR